jgi:DNA mismatch repair protein MutS
LYQVQSGAASQSYGIQVAKLAGVPKPVLDIARTKLRGFEQQAVLGDTAATGQSDLFVANVSSDAQPLIIEDTFTAPNSTDERAEEVIEELSKIDVNDLTPRQALDILDHLQQLAEGKAGQKL